MFATSFCTNVPCPVPKQHKSHVQILDFRKQGTHETARSDKRIRHTTDTTCTKLVPPVYLQVETQAQAVPPAEGGGQGAFCSGGGGGAGGSETAALDEPLDTTGVAEIKNNSPYHADFDGE